MIKVPTSKVNIPMKVESKTPKKLTIDEMEERIEELEAEIEDRQTTIMWIRALIDKKRGAQKRSQHQ